MVLKLFFLTLIAFFLAKTPLAWGFSVERTENYVAQARTLNLAQEQEWLRLGHYQKKWLGGYHSKIRGDFFLDAKGADDPENELIATVRSLFTESSSKSQCRYLARTQWLSGVLKIHPDDLLKCGERISWKRKLNAQEIYLVFAANDLNSAASSFGHTFLRLHDPNHFANMDILDYGVNFAAQTDDSGGALFALKGLFGAYPGFYSMMPFHLKMREYTNLEGRDLWEYKLNLSPVQVDLIVDHLLELEGSYIPYYFLDENCSYQLLELLEVARPDLNLVTHFHDGVIPLETLKVIAAQKDFLIGEKQRPSLKRSFHASYNQLNSSQKTQIVKLADRVKEDSPAAEIEIIQDRKVLDTAMAYIDLQDFRGLKNSKDWRYQLALQRSKLGAGDFTSKDIASPGSPLASADAIGVELGYGKRDEKNFGQFKLRRAFHDLLSRDEGVAPFSHMEVLSFTLRRALDSGLLDLQELKILKIISTLPVTRLEHPLSWKVDFGTEVKNPKLEGGGGYSFDIETGGRISSLIAARAFREEEKNRIGGGPEIFYLQKISGGTRSLLWATYLGFGDRSPLFEGGIALSQDIASNFELRLSYERKLEANEGLLNLMFSF